MKKRQRDMNGKIVSVVIPTYKPQKYIKECIDSVCRQTIGMDNLELIVVLNGCCEPYMQELHEYVSGKTGLDARLLQTDVPGVSNARNIGIDAAVGDYLCFIDDDDWVSDCYLQKLLEAASDDADMVEANVLNYDEESQVCSDDYLTKAFRRFGGEHFLPVMKARSFLSSSCCKIIRRKAIDADRFDTRFAIGEDGLFMARISRRLKVMRCASADAVYYRRVRQGSASRKKESVTHRAAYYARLAWAYTRVWTSDCLHYSLPFFASRYVALLLHVIRQPKY